MDWLLAISFYFWGVYTALVFLLRSQTDYDYGIPTIVLAVMTASLLWISSHHRSQKNSKTFTNPLITSGSSAVASGSFITSASPKIPNPSNMQRILEAQIVTLKSRNNNLIANMAGVLDELERHDQNIHGSVDMFLSQRLYPKSAEMVKDALKTGSWRRLTG